MIRVLESKSTFPCHDSSQVVRNDDFMSLPIKRYIIFNVIRSLSTLSIREIPETSIDCNTASKICSIRLRALVGITFL